MVYNNIEILRYLRNEIKFVVAPQLPLRQFAFPILTLSQHYV